MKKDFFNNLDWTKVVALSFCTIMLLVFLVPNLALAASAPPTPTGGSSSGDAIATVLCTIVGALQGEIGKAVATIAIVVLGIGLFLGKLSWPLAVATAIGIGMIFGASELVGWIATGAGKGAIGSCPTN